MLPKIHFTSMITFNYTTQARYGFMFFIPAPDHTGKYFVKSGSYIYINMTINQINFSSTEVQHLKSIYLLSVPVVKTNTYVYSINQSVSKLLFLSSKLHNWSFSNCQESTLELISFTVQTVDTMHLFWFAFLVLLVSVKKSKQPKTLN